MIFPLTAIRQNLLLTLFCPFCILTLLTSISPSSFVFSPFSNIGTDTSPCPPKWNLLISGIFSILRYRNRILCTFERILYRTQLTVPHVPYTLMLRGSATALTWWEPSPTCPWRRSSSAYATSSRGRWSTPRTDPPEPPTFPAPHGFYISAPDDFQFH